jgi:hypothetical protein
MAVNYRGKKFFNTFPRFHPNKELVLTASGDATAHIWQCAVHLFSENNTPGDSAIENLFVTAALAKNKLEFTDFRN